MYACMHACMYVCICVYMFIYIHIETSLPPIYLSIYDLPIKLSFSLSLYRFNDLSKST